MKGAGPSSVRTYMYTTLVHVHAGMQALEPFARRGRSSRTKGAAARIPGPAGRSSAELSVGQNSGGSGSGGSSISSVREEYIIAFVCGVSWHLQPLGGGRGVVPAAALGQSRRWLAAVAKIGGGPLLNELNFFLGRDESPVGSRSGQNRPSRRATYRAFRRASAGAKTKELSSIDQR